MVASEASATVMVPLSIEDMAVRSAAVVRARVSNRRSAWDEDHRKIYTYTELEVLETVHASGKVPQAIVVRTLGGEVGKVGMKVSGTARFNPGEEVLLFLRSDPINNQHFQVIGMSQGKYRLERESKGQLVAIPGLEGIAFARRDETGRLKIGHGEHGANRIPFEALRQKILEAVTAQRTPTPEQPSVPSAPSVPQTPGTITR